MPLIFREQMNATTVAAVWHISESIAELKERLSIHEKSLEAIRLEQKKLHFLASRVLLNEVSAAGAHRMLGYDPFGKPLLPGKQVSFSHSGDKVAVLLSGSGRVGIDIERVREKIRAIAPKFMSAEELAACGESIDALHVYWGAKEALYKYYGRKGLIFSRQLLLQPFEYKAPGEISARIITSEFLAEVPLRYHRIGEHMLVFTAE